MTYSHRFWLYAPVAAVLVLFAALSAYWYAVSTAVDRHLTALNGKEVAPGLTLHYDYKEIGGFPFRVDVILTGLTLKAETDHGPLIWQAQHFAVHSLDYGGLHLVFEAAGTQRLTWQDTSGHRRSIAFTPVLFRASALGQKGVAERIDVELFGAADANFRVDHGEFHLRRDPEVDGYDLYIMADQLKLPAGLITDEPDDLTRLRLKARLGPSAPWLPLLSGHEGPAAAAQAFAAVHGVIDIASLDLGWDKTEATGKGALTLDAVGRPEGLLHLMLNGAPQSAPARPHGILDALMSAAKGSGTVPLTLAVKDGLAYLNSTPMGFVKPLF